jgi:chromosomal replication initiation ATPase DnaA
LPFDQAPRFGIEDFMPSGSNAAASAAIAAWPVWPDRVLLLIGPEGSGKSHMARIWADRSGAIFLRPDDLEGDLRHLACRPVVIEDADRVAMPEAPMFHLLNLVREAESSLLVTARRPPDTWSLGTADVVSRLRLAPSVALEEPDEALMRAVLVKLFADRQLAVDATLVDYLALRLDRSLAAAGAAVEALDRASLDGGRRISRTLAAHLFGEPRLDGP